MRALVLLAVLALVGCRSEKAPAVQDAPAPKELRQFGIQVPPVKYVRHASFVLHTGMPDEINSFCNGGVPPADGVILACTGMDSKEVVMPHPCLYADVDPYAMLLCHEIAHVNGWPGDHPDGQ